jgi:hypothetical protein
VLLSVIAGVPAGYPDGEPIVFRDSLDPEVTELYGIGPGCNFGQESIHQPTGLPPVRLLELARRVDPPEHDVFSICAEDYTGALSEIGRAIGAAQSQACIDGCVADDNPAVSGLQPACEVQEVWLRDDGTVAETTIPPCQETEVGWDFPSPDHALCYFARELDPAVDETCRDSVVANLWIGVERRPDSPVRYGSRVDVECQLEAPVGYPCG